MFKAIKTEQVLVITKLIFNTNFSLEITSKVKNRFTHKLTTKRNFQTLSLFFSSTVTEWNAQDCGISKAAKDTSMLPSNLIREVGASGDRKIRACLAAFRPWKSFRAQTIYLLASSNLFYQHLNVGTFHEKSNMESFPSINTLKACTVLYHFLDHHLIR